MAGVRKAIEGAGCELLCLPPDGPDLNPIENALSKPRRSAAERTVEKRWRTIGRLLDRLQPDECRNDFLHCGYAHNASRT